MKIKDWKKLISDLEIFIMPIGTPSQPVHDMGIGTYEDGDIF